MANIKIAQLTNQTAISDNDLIIVESATSTNKMTVGKLKELIGIQKLLTLSGGLEFSTPNDLNNATKSIELFSVDSNTQNGLMLDGICLSVNYGAYNFQLLFALGANTIYHRRKYGEWSGWKQVTSV